MKNKGFFKTAAALLAALVLLGGFSVPAYAGGGEDIPTDDSGVIVETEPQPLTPDGNLLLIDDIEGEATEDKQFIVVQSKNGNYFYIIVDRAAEGENTVHFLNQVDEADLMALMEDGGGKAQAPAVCTCKDKCKAGAVNTACPVCSVNMTECVGKEAVPEPDDAPPEKEKSNAGGLVIFLVVTLLAGGGAFYYFIVRLDVGGAEAASARISDAADAEVLKTACEASQTICISVRRERKTEQPPRLFDLTGLQREANRIYGYTAKQTLDLAQALYEKRLLTYPRTDSNYLPDDMGDTAVHIAALLVGKLPFMKGAAFTPDIARTLDSKKVSDHHAIIPTMELAKADLAALPESERNILTLAGARLLFAAAEPHIFDAVTAVFSCADTEFTAKGKTVLCDGWKELERRYRATLKGKPDAEGDEENERILDVPTFAEGQSFDSPAARVTAHDTQPPKPHTEASLLSAMERAGSTDTDPAAERKGLGTPATRAAVIEKLVKSGFVQRKGKQLIPTKNGNNLVCVLPDTLTSPQLTAEWENALTQIARGAAEPEDFMRGIEEMARELVKAYPFLSENQKDLFKEEQTVIGKCPRCGGNVCEGRKNYYCEKKGCAFVMWKNDRFFEERKTAFTPKIAAALLNGGKAKVKKLYSPKTGKTYDGSIVLADTGGKYVNYRIELARDKELTQQA